MKSMHFASICTGNHLRTCSSRRLDLSSDRAGAIDLEVNAFFSEIPPEVVDEAGSPVTVTETAAALPQMNGSGMVRNLRAAMSLTGTAADELEAAVTSFAAATTRDAQRAQIDSLITEWAQTSRPRHGWGLKSRRTQDHMRIPMIRNRSCRPNIAAMT